MPDGVFDADESCEFDPVAVVGAFECVVRADVSNRPPVGDYNAYGIVFSFAVLLLRDYDLAFFINRVYLYLAVKLPAHASATLGEK